MFIPCMASSRRTCRCMSLNLIMTVFWRAFCFSIFFLASHSFNFFLFSFQLSLPMSWYVHDVAAYVMVCSWRCRVCHGIFMTPCSMSNDVQRRHSFLFKMAFWSKPTHFKEKQSFSLENSSSLGWVIAKRESSSKVQRGAWMPGQRRAGQLVTNKNTLSNCQNLGVWVKIKLACLFLVIEIPQNKFPVAFTGQCAWKRCKLGLHSRLLLS